jgi:pyrroloquinoline quinone biosynthesis protein E
VRRRVEKAIEMLLAVQGLKNLLSSRIRYIGVATVVTKLNLADIPNLIDWLESLGVPLLRLMRFMPLGRGSEQKRLELNKEEILELFSIISKKQWEMKSLLIRVSDAYKAMLAEKALYTCNAAKTWCAVDSNGYVFPCTLMISPDNREILDIENIRSKPLKDIWMNNKLFEDLRGVEKIEGTCRKCDKLELCQGGCRSYALAKCGKVFDSDPICSYLRG